MIGELDQVLGQYRDFLKNIASLLAQMTQFGLCDMILSKDAEEMIVKLESAVARVMDKHVSAEKARQAVLDIRMVLDISQQTVDAKSKHLGQEEKQKEEAQTLRFREFQKIHKLQDEKALLEKELSPAKRRLTQLMTALDEKYEKKRIVESFHNTLTEHCANDMISLKDQVDECRAERSKWDRPDLDMADTLSFFTIDHNGMKLLERSVFETREVLRNQKMWYDEEMHTKLFYSTRCKELKHRITMLKNLIRRLDNAEHSEDIIEDIDESRYNYRPEHILVDGSPGVQAKEVERYLSHQFGMKVLADYTMLRRLKDEIGVQGLAYLVEKVRLQGTRCNKQTPFSGSCVDWEERQVEHALKGIALEYRDREENKRMLRIPGVRSDPAGPTEDPQDCSAMSDFEFQSTSYLSNTPPVPGQRTTPDSSLSVDSGSSSVSLKKRTSLARIKKFLKL